MKKTRANLQSTNIMFDTGFREGGFLLTEKRTIDVRYPWKMFKTERQ